MGGSRRLHDGPTRHTHGLRNRMRFVQTLLQRGNGGGGEGRARVVGVRLCTAPPTAAQPPITSPLPPHQTSSTVAFASCISQRGDDPHHNKRGRHRLAEQWQQPKPPSNDTTNPNHPKSATTCTGRESQNKTEPMGPHKAMGSPVGRGAWTQAGGQANTACDAQCGTHASTAHLHRLSQA